MSRDLTYRQLRAVENWIRGGRKSKAKALREASYSEAVARVPSKVFDSPAVKQELERRGHGSRGVLNNHFPDPKTKKEETKQKAPEFEPEKLSSEDLQLLQKKLDELPDVPQVDEQAETNASFTPTTGIMEGAFDLGKQERNTTSKNRNYSSV